MNAQDIMQAVEADRNFWIARDRQIDSDYARYEECSVVFADREGEAVVKLPDARTLVDKMASMLGTREPTIEVRPLDVGDEASAEKVTQFCYYFLDTIERLWHRGLRQSLRIEMAQSEALTGWICSRLLLNPENLRFPFEYSLEDPLTVYPRFANNRLVRVSQVVRMSAMEAKELYRRGRSVHPALRSLHDSDIVEVYAYYDDAIMAVVYNGEFLKPPTQHGYGLVPWEITVVGGPYFRQRLTNSQWQDRVGQPIWGGYRAVLDAKSKIASMLLTMLGKQADPPVVVSTSEVGQVDQLSLGIGGRNWILPEDKFQLVTTGPNLPDISAVASMFQQALDRGTIPPALFGELGVSGYAQQLAMGSARDQVTPYVRALERHLEGLLRLMLRLLVRFAPAIPFTRLDESGKRVGQQISFVEVARVGDEVRVTLEDVAPQDEATLANLAGMLVDRQLVSLDTARKAWLPRLRYPQLEGQKVLQELVLREPVAVQVLAIRAAQQLGDPLVTLLLAQALERYLQDVVGRSPLSSPSSRPLGASPSTLPPEAGTNAGAPPGTDTLGAPSGGPAHQNAPDTTGRT